MAREETPYRDEMEALRMQVDFLQRLIETTYWYGMEVRASAEDLFNRFDLGDEVEPPPKDAREMPGIADAVRVLLKTTAPKGRARKTAARSPDQVMKRMRRAVAKFEKRKK